MALSLKERKDQLGVWLYNNSSLQNTEEYQEKAQMFLETRNKLQNMGRKDELGNWLYTNSDKEGTDEYVSKSREFLSLREELGQESTPATKTTKGEAFRRGMVQGATFELYDEIKSGVRAATSFLVDNPSGQSFSEMYDKFKQEEEDLMNSYRAEHGGSYIGGQVAGGISTLPLGGVLGKTGQVLFGIGGRGTTATQTALKAGTAGAAQAGLAGFGAGDDLESRLKNAAIGIGLGGLTAGGVSAGGFKLAEKIANSSNGLLYRTAGLGASPKSTVDLTKELTPQLTALADAANKARDAAYSGWRATLDSAVDSSGIKIFREATEDGAPKVISTKELKKLIKGFDKVLDNDKNLKAIINESDNVSFDTYRNLYSTAWDLQKQLPKNKAVPFAKRLDALKGDEYRQLDKMFPKKGIGSARQAIDKAVSVSETGQLLNKEIVQKIAKGEALDETFAKQFLPNNSKSLDNFSNLMTRVNSWAKEAGLPPSQVDEILAPLRATALSDAINNPKLLSAIADKNKTSEQLTVFEHYKKLLTNEQFSFISKLSKAPDNHLRRRIRSLLDYHSGMAVLGTVGVGGGLGAYTAMTGNPMGIAGLALLGTYTISPVLMNSLAKNKQLLTLTDRILTAPSDVPTKELMKTTTALGKAALKAGIITPTAAARTLSELQEFNKQAKEKEDSFQ